MDRQPTRCTCTRARVRALLAVAAGAALFGAGYLAGGARLPAAAVAEPPLVATYGEACSYWLRTQYLPGGGTATVLTALVATWDSWSQEWRSVSDWTARSAVGGFSCERQY